MNLLALITDGFDASGGIARYNQDLMLALAQSSAVGQVIALPRHGAEVGMLPARVVQLGAEPSRLAWSRRAVMLAARNHFDAIFCGHLNAAPLAAVLARLLRIPLWLQAHGIEAWHPSGRFARRAVQDARLVTAVSRCTRDRLLSWTNLDPARVRVLPNTMSDSYRPGLRPAHLVERHGLEGRKVILTVGRVAASERYKGHDRILKALPAVLARVPDAAFLIVGDGNDRPRLQQMARDVGVAGRVVFAGSVGQDELAAYFRLADVFAMPSTGEGFGIVFLEAARSGVPVIGGNKDGSVDALGDGEIGTMIDPDDEDQLASALVTALHAGRPATPNLAVERFAFDHFARHVDDLVRQHLA